MFCNNIHLTLFVVELSSYFDVSIYIQGQTQTCEPVCYCYRQYYSLPLLRHLRNSRSLQLPPHYLLPQPRPLRLLLLYHESKTENRVHHHLKFLLSSAHLWRKNTHRAYYILMSRTYLLSAGHVFLYTGLFHDLAHSTFEISVGIFCQF